MYMRRRILLATLCIRGFGQLMVPRENPPFFFLRWTEILKRGIQMEVCQLHIKGMSIVCVE